MTTNGMAAATWGPGMAVVDVARRREEDMCRILEMFGPFDDVPASLGRFTLCPANSCGIAIGTPPFALLAPAAPVFVCLAPVPKRQGASALICSTVGA
eukprot:gene4742-4916_t